MVFIILFTCFMFAVVTLLAIFVKQDGASRVRFRFIYNFIILYEKEAGVRLSTDQAISLIQVTIATMAKSPRDKVYLDAGYPAAQRVADSLCAEAERKVWR